MVCMQVLPFTESPLRTLFADQDDAGRHEMHLDAQPLEVLGGLAPDELVELEVHGDRVTFVFSLILGQLGARRRVGGLPSEPPVYSRVLHVLSDGMLGYQQSKKLEDTPFPFPYAQLLAFMLYAFSLIFPLLAASKVGGDIAITAATDLGTPPLTTIDRELSNSGLDLESAAVRWAELASHLAAPLLTFLTVLSYFGMHEVARELEDPFTHPPNELPAAELQQELNERLLAAWDGAVAGDALSKECTGKLVPDSAVESLLGGLSRRRGEVKVSHRLGESVRAGAIDSCEPTTCSPENPPLSLPRVSSGEGGDGVGGGGGDGARGGGREASRLLATPALDRPLRREGSGRLGPNRFWECSSSQGSSALRRSERAAWCESDQSPAPSLRRFLSEGAGESDQSPAPSLRRFLSEGAGVTLSNLISAEGARAGYAPVADPSLIDMTAGGSTVAGDELRSSSPGSGRLGQQLWGVEEEQPRISAVSSPVLRPPTWRPDGPLEV